MNNPYPERKKLDHRGPLSVRTTDSVYFITIAGANRDTTELADHAAEILSAARFYQTAGKWFLYLLLVMPDHLHMLVHFPVGRDVPIAPRSSDDTPPVGRDVPSRRNAPTTQFRLIAVPAR